MKVAPNFSPRAALWIFPLAVAVAVSLSAITSRSLWIDEAWTAHLARQPTLGTWWAELVGEKVTDLQMPFYSFWIWGIEKITGPGEYALRAANMFWFAPALFLLVRSFPRQRSLGLAAMLAAASSPFAWYYLNEARSYVMQAGCSLMVYAALARLTQGGFDTEHEEDRWVWLFAGTFVLLCGSSLLAMVLAIAPLAMLPALIPGGRRSAFFRRHSLKGLVVGVVLVGLAGYYVWTLSIGARATAIAGTDWRNPAFVAYELAGFSGLGPGRAAMREGGFREFLPYAGLLAAYGLVAGGLMASGAMELRRRLGTRRWGMLILAVLAPAVFVFAASYFKHFRVLGRHFAAMAPVVTLLLAYGAIAAWRRITGKFFLAVYVALGLGSALSLRLAERHLKEDYRLAGAMAKATLSQGGRIWWNADRKAADYYGLPLTESTHPQGAAATYLMNPESSDLNGLSLPDRVICGRSEVYDGSCVLAKWLSKNQFHPTTAVRGFVVWEKPAAK